MPQGIASSLRRLRGLHLRLSLCRVTLARGSDGRLGTIDSRSLIAEPAADGSLVVIYIHSQGISDADAASGIAARLEQALRDSGVPLASVRLAILHCDAASIDENDTTLAALSGQPSRPLLIPGGPVLTGVSKAP